MNCFSAAEAVANFVGAAKKKVSLPIWKMLLLGVLAGMFIALGGVSSGAASHAVTDAGLAKTLSGVLFPGGLALVVLMGAELFTGNCLMAGPALTGKVKWAGLLKNWGLVYLGNMCGAFLLSALVYHSGLMANADLAAAAKSVAANKCSLSFIEALLRGIGCNILVCGAVWMASGAQNAGGKAVCCFFPIMLFVACGFEHSVANMYYIPLGLQLGAEVASMSAYLLSNLLPVTLGNILGGAGLGMIYAAIYHD